ncbi:hypothetical protein [Plasmodium yoelii yoelii]|uniref:Uncharacterized protein n=1 Tax=Plasmodium yoelii yoelii TaxID=73239 RepID=Q7RL48_PLAYO|nr:hypothetical protein [Plasmodium yoelii yoelii]
MLDHMKKDKDYNKWRRLNYGTFGEELDQEVASYLGDGENDDKK